MCSEIQNLCRKHRTLLILVKSKKEIFFSNCAAFSENLDFNIFENQSLLLSLHLGNRSHEIFKAQNVYKKYQMEWQVWITCNKLLKQPQSVASLWLLHIWASFLIFLSYSPFILRRQLQKSRFFENFGTFWFVVKV